MNPTFEEKVLEHKDGHYIVQDWMGNITEISDEYDFTYIRSAKDVVAIRFSGPFWQMREWCGFEPLCMMFIDQPDLVEEMAGFWTDYVSKVLRRLLEAGVVDCVGMSEDMAYKEKSMISPACAFGRDGGREKETRPSDGSGSALSALPEPPLPRSPPSAAGDLRV
jgi:uroporphyrinogen-III decarboxylase